MTVTTSGLCVSLLVATTAQATLLCVRHSGELRLRADACHAKETPVDLAAIGLVGPQGPQGPAGPPGRAAAPTVDLTGRVEALETLTAPFSRQDDALVLSGVNLQVVNGAGSTATTNGLGNVILGYNEQRPTDFNVETSCTGGEPALAVRTGSHNLIVGTQHEYVSYSSLLVGRWHFSNGPYSAVLGGARCNAVGEGAVAIAGSGNRADRRAVAIGGTANGINDYPGGPYGATEGTVLIGGNATTSVALVTIGGSFNYPVLQAIPDPTPDVWISGTWLGP